MSFFFSEHELRGKKSKLVSAERNVKHRWVKVLFPYAALYEMIMLFINLLQQKSLLV